MVYTVPLRESAPKSEGSSSGGSLPEERRHGYGPLLIAFGVVAAGMLAYCQTIAFHWDEGFHAVAAELIRVGERPYIDFCFPQTPLNAYWNAVWIAVFGPSWRGLHVVATLATLGSIALTVQYIFRVFAERNWQLSAAFVGLALFAFHPETWAVGTILQAYPVCLLLLVVAFRAAIVGISRRGIGLSVACGACAGAAVASSLLTAVAAPVLLVWMWLHNRAGSRWSKAAGFVGGAAAACLPILALFLRGPRQTIFNILSYQTLYRRVGWPGATVHDVGIVTNWLNSSPSLLLVLLAAAGAVFVRRGGVDAARRAEAYLCLWLALGLGAQNALAHPTFPMYFVFLVPFLAVLGVWGFYGVLARLGDPALSRRAVAALIGVLALCAGNTVYNSVGYYTWPEMKEVATKVEQVTPADGAILAPEQIYFLSGRPVPAGMEFYHSHKLTLPAAREAMLHIVSQAEVDQQIKAGAFATTVFCEEEDKSNAVKSWDVYAQETDVEDCSIFYQLKKK